MVLSKHRAGLCEDTGLPVIVNFTEMRAMGQAEWVAKNQAMEKASCKRSLSMNIFGGQHGF